MSETARIQFPSPIRLAVISGTCVAAGGAWVAAVALAPTVNAEDMPREIWTLMIAAGIALTVAAVMQALSYSGQKHCAENQRAIAIAIAENAAETEALRTQIKELYWGSFAEGAVAGASGSVVPFPRHGSN